MNQERGAFGWLKGTVSIQGDIVGPTSEEWDAHRVLDRAMVDAAAKRMGCTQAELLLRNLARHSEWL